MGLVALGHLCMFSVVSDSLQLQLLKAASQAPLTMEFSRQEYWTGLPFPPKGNLPDPGIKPKSLGSPVLPGRFLTTGLQGKSLNLLLTVYVSRRSRSQNETEISHPQPRSLGHHLWGSISLCQELPHQADHCLISQGRGLESACFCIHCTSKNWTHSHPCLCPGFGLASLWNLQPGPESHCSGVLTSFLSFLSFHYHHIPSRYTAKEYFSITQMKCKVAR